MKTLLLDNYDSFSHILWQYLWEVNGEEPLLVPNDAWSVERIRSERFDNILISPGPGRPDNPADFGVCAAVIAAFPEVPILGVCLGHQGLGLHAGGSVAPAPRVRHGKASRILHDGQGLFAGLPQAFTAVRYHSLAVAPGSIPAGASGAAVTATAEDDGQIMGLAFTSRPCYGVQFHPESIGTEHGKALLANFRDLTAGGPRQGGPVAAVPSSGPAPIAAPIAAPAAKPPPRRISAPCPFRELPWRDPEAAFERCFAGAPAAFWLDSQAAPAPGEPLVTYMGSGAALLEVRGNRLRALAVEAGGALREVAAIEGDPFSLLAAELAHTVPGELPFAFRGGLVGWLGYELKRHAGGGDRPGTPPSDLPDALFLAPTRLLAFDHSARRAWACLLPGGRGEALAAVPAAVAAAASGDATPAGDLAWLDATAADWESLGPASPLDLVRAGPDPRSPAAGRLPLRLHASREEYLASIRSLQGALLAGESYEACLTNEIRVTADADPFRVYRILRRTNPAPYAAFLRFPQASVLCASPERFLKLDAGGRLECRPIKGTRRRGATAQEDAALKAELASHPKDRSENLMIVDLVRNDFGRVCEMGSVEVPESMAVEEHPTVFQMVSTVTGRLRAGAGGLDAVRACFPGGSMTGAPKKRTLELLEDRERRPRGVFSGALGWLGADGTLDLGMVIRTLVAANGGYRVGCGGAILAESDPEAEFDEALLKAMAPLRALELALRGEGGGWTLRG